MKKLMTIIALLVVAAPTVCFGWSDSFGPASEDQMRKAVCRNAVRLSDEFVSYTDLNGYRQTDVRHKVDLSPDKTYADTMVITKDSPYAGMFPVGSVVTHFHTALTHESAGPSFSTSPAGSSYFGGSSMTRFTGDWYTQAR